jgi:hypothetical protein
MLAFLQFTTPLLLAGLGLLSLPIIAHLLQRHARKELVFPTVAFLLAAVATQSRFHKFKRWLLLLLRLLAAACIVLAFARPVWFDASPAEAATPGESAAVVLVVDVSASTGQTQDGLTALEHLRGAANRALDSLRQGSDVANLIVADSAPQAALPRLSPNLPLLRAELAKLQATEERADLHAAIDAAGKLLADHAGAKRVVILSDLQETNWSEALEDSSLYQLLPLGTRVTVADIDAAVPANVALSNPRFYPPQPLAGQQCELTVHAQNFSDGVRQVRVSLNAELASQSVSSQEQTVTLNPGEGRDVLFTATAPETGALLATFSIPPDGLTADDRAFLVVEATQRIPILLVSDDSPAEPGTAAYYLLRALAPQGDETDRFEVRHQRSAELTPGDFSNVRGVFIGYLADLTPTAAKTIVDYVDSGGGVIFFSGEGPVPRNLAALQSAAGEREFLPWSPGMRRETTGRDEAYTINSGRWQSRWFREFDEQSQLAIARIRFDRSWFVPPPSPAAEVLLNFADGQPALGLRAFGNGQFLVANFGLEANATDLGKHGAFVAMMQMLARSLLPDAASAPLNTPGKALTFPQRIAAESIAALKVLGPDGQTVASTNISSPEGARVEIARPLRIGFYQVQVDDQMLGAAAVNLDPRESDLRRVTAEQLTDRLRGQGVQTETAATTGWDPVLNLEGRPLWGTFFVTALCAIGAELLLLGWWRK